MHKKYHYIGKKKALEEVSVCPKCKSTALEYHHGLYRCLHDVSCCWKGEKDELETKFIIPVGERFSTDKLTNIFDMNKLFTDVVRDDEKPRPDLAENIIEELLHTCSENHVGGFDDEDLTRFEKSIKDIKMVRNAMAIQTEVGEYCNEIPFKWWGRGMHHVDKKKAAMELIDLLHFMMIAFDDLGYDSKGIYKLYCEKQIENRRRFLEKRGWDEANR